MTSYPQQQIQLTPVEQPAAGRLQKSVFDTVAEPALIRTSLLEDRKDKAMQRRSFPAHIFDKISSIGKLMFIICRTFIAKLLYSFIIFYDLISKLITRQF